MINEMGEQRTVLSNGMSESSPSQRQLTFTPSQQLHNPTHQFQISYHWDQELEKFEKDKVSMFVCNLCMKTFYNQNALQNHKNMTHDVADCDETVHWSACAKIEQDVDGLCGFKFIPLNPEDIDDCNSLNSIITRSFTEDTSYLLVKVDDEDPENYYTGKQSQLDNQLLVKKVLQNSETPPVDLRGPFTCTLPSTMCPDLQCRQTFFSCCEYSLHYRDEHTKRRKSSLRCQVCEKRLDKESTTSKTRLAEEYHASNSFILPCRICGLQFSDESKYEEHNRLMHAKMKPHQCSICYKRFAQLGGLQQHLRMHTGIRPFVCTFCPKAFTQKAGLDQHLRIHTKVKPFKCVVCSKCFSQSVHLRQHMRTHTNIQPFECSVCKKRFKQRSHLNFHLRSHMNEHIVAARRYEAVMRRTSDLEFNFEKFHHAENAEALYYDAELASEPLSSSRAANVNVPNPYDSPPAHDRAGKVNISNAYNIPSGPTHDANIYYNQPVSFRAANVNISNNYKNLSAPAANFNVSNAYIDPSDPQHTLNATIPNHYANTHVSLRGTNVGILSPYNNPPPPDRAGCLNMPNLFDNPPIPAHAENLNIPSPCKNPPVPDCIEENVNISNNYNNQLQNMLPILEASAPPV